jgi:glycosyltransferase involved in cell wall biosynthesis
MSSLRVIVFLPAHNEEITIGKVIERIPRDVHPSINVKILVIDDGSRDQTVQAALEAGADYIYSFSENKGLGAAVRMGLMESVRLGADIAVMIDADNEYPPDEIPNLIQPILNGEANYVIGSRFMRKVRGMKLYRRLGNIVFSFLQSVLLGKWIHDGQSGMRAFSREAAEQAEIIHDYNYAQVLTMNLLRKGFQMTEIPISYQVRTEGKSFIKMNYIIKVIPAMIKEMRRPVTKLEKESISYMKVAGERLS